MKLFFILSFIVITACSYTVNVQPPNFQPPAVEKIPLTVGIFYSEDLKNHKCIVNKGYIAESFEIQLGKSSIKMFDLILDAFFENIEKVDSMNSAFNKGFRNVIELRLRRYSGCEVGWPIVTATIIVVYEATLYSDEATVISTWQGKGRSMPGDSHESCGPLVFSFDVETRYLANSTCIAMRMAAADFIINFEKDPAISTYLEK